MFSVLEAAKKGMNLPKQVRIFDTTWRTPCLTPRFLKLIPVGID